MSHFRQRVVLIHKLRQLRRAKKLFYRCCNRFGVDQVLRHKAFRLSHRQTLFNRTLNTNQTYTELVLCHFTHRTNTTVTQVIDIIHNAFTIANVDEGFQYVNDVVVRKSAFTGIRFTLQTTVELHPAYARQVVTLLSEKQVLEQSFCRLFCRWLARTHHTVNLYQRFQLASSRINTQGVGNEGTAIQFVGVESF